MNYVILYAAISGYDFGLNYTVKTIADTLDELNVSTKQFNLGFLDIPYFDGVNSAAVENVFGSIEQSDGVILAMTASKSAPCALMQTFIEHFDFDVYKNPFEGKNCFTVILSRDESQIKTDEYIEALLYSVGAVPAVRLLAGSRYIPLIGKDDEVKEMIEKYAEDFYRMKNRKLFINNISVPDKPKADMPRASEAQRYENTQNPYIDNFNQRQEEDINELTRLFSQQYKAEKNTDTHSGRDVADMYESNMYSENLMPHTAHKTVEAYKTQQNYTNAEVYKPKQELYSSKIMPSVRTCKQKTQNLHHYFQPQYADNINAVIQINISGDENFSGYVTLLNGLCSYDEGRHNNPDVVIFADTSVWNDVLDAKYTIQKAFMIGQIKVKGNFMLLSHFDKVFKLKQQ